MTTLNNRIQASYLLSSLSLSLFIFFPLPLFISIETTHPPVFTAYFILFFVLSLFLSLTHSFLSLSLFHPSSRLNVLSLQSRTLLSCTSESELIHSADTFTWTDTLSLLPFLSLTSITVLFLSLPFSFLCLCVHSNLSPSLLIFFFYCNEFCTHILQQNVTSFIPPFPWQLSSSLSQHHHPSLPTQVTLVDNDQYQQHYDPFSV